MTRVGDGTAERTTWVGTKDYPGQYADTMPWHVLNEAAKAAFYWLRENERQCLVITRKPDPEKRDPGDMACMVAALYVPQPSGGLVYFGTIPRGPLAEQMAVRENAEQHAPQWLQANIREYAVLSRIHCEDVACYTFESSNSTLENDDPAKVRTPSSGHYVPVHPITGVALAKMRIAVWGIRSWNHNQEGEPQLPCDGEDSKHPKSLRVKLSSAT